MLKYVGFCITLLLASCSSPYMGKSLFGADEFVLDSYKIREGKFSILEMEGKTFDELDEGLLCLEGRIPLSEGCLDCNRNTR